MRFISSRRNVDVFFVRLRRKEIQDYTDFNLRNSSTIEIIVCIASVTDIEIDIATNRQLRLFACRNS